MADLDDELARFEAEIASLTAGLSGGDDSQDGQSGSAPPAHSPPPSSSPNTTQTSTPLPLPIPVRPPSTSHPVPPPSAHSINAGPSVSPAPPKEVEIFQPPVKYHKDAKKPVFQRVKAIDQAPPPFAAVITPARTTTPSPAPSAPVSRPHSVPPSNTTTSSIPPWLAAAGVPVSVPVLAPAQVHAQIEALNTKAIPAAAPEEKKDDKPADKKRKMMRSAAGDVWEDSTLADWPDNDFRLFCGDLGNEVNDETLAAAFRCYPSFNKARVVRDKRTMKSKGYGFISFLDPVDFQRAMKEKNGKYVGNRPIKLRKSTWKDRMVDDSAGVKPAKPFKKNKKSKHI